MREMRDYVLDASSEENCDRINQKSNVTPGGSAQKKEEEGQLKGNINGYEEICNVRH
jgi:hypothetical protein